LSKLQLGDAVARIKESFFLLVPIVLLVGMLILPYIPKRHYFIYIFSLAAFSFLMALVRQKYFSKNKDVSDLLKLIFIFVIANMVITLPIFLLVVSNHLDSKTATIIMVILNSILAIWFLYQKKKKEI
jgi:hypothetical protein